MGRTTGNGSLIFFPGGSVVISNPIAIHVLVLGYAMDTSVHGYADHLGPCIGGWLAGLVAWEGGDVLPSRWKKNPKGSVLFKTLVYRLGRQDPSLWTGPRLLYVLLKKVGVFITGVYLKQSKMLLLLIGMGKSL